MAQVAALKKENKKKRGKYIKQSKQTQSKHIQVCIGLASKEFLPLDEFMMLKGIAKKSNKPAAAWPVPTSEFNNIINPFQEESKEGSNKANIRKTSSVLKMVLK